MSIGESYKTYRNTRLVVGVIAGFFVSAFASCTEIKYAIWGESAEAKVTHVKKSQYQSRRSTEDAMTINYSWSEKGGLARKDLMTVSASVAPSEGDTIAIDYLPGAKGSRRHGKKNYFALVFFFGASGVMLFFVGRLMWEGRK